MSPSKGPCFRITHRVLLVPVMLENILRSRRQMCEIPPPLAMPEFAPFGAPVRLVQPAEPLNLMGVFSFQHQNSLNDLVFDEEVSKFKSPKSPVLGLECP